MASGAASGIIACNPNNKNKKGNSRPMPRPPRRCLTSVAALLLAVVTLTVTALVARADPAPTGGSAAAVAARAREALVAAGGAREAPSRLTAEGLAPEGLAPEGSGKDSGMSLAEHASIHLQRRDLVVGRPNADHDDSYVYRLPYGDGVSYAVLQGYGARLSHRGSEYFTVDFRMVEGTLVHAAREGTVVLVEDSHAESCWAEGCGRFANFVVVLHADGTTGEYFHLQRGSALVAPGDRVTRGQPIARSGNTGYSTTPHLHFGVYRANADGSTQSVGIRFLARGGLVVEPRSGARYVNAASATATVE